MTRKSVAMSRAITQPDLVAGFPRTRYQGSKRKLADSIVRCLDDLDYHSVLDAFGGSGAVSYAFKRSGKSVTYNDCLAFNHQFGVALIENDRVTLDVQTAAQLGRRIEGVEYRSVIEDTFDGVYFTRAENRWLDTAVVNLRRIPCRFQRAIAWFALCQSAMAKRPYNLFHRRNLYMRTSDVTRSFGNKATWDRSFENHVSVVVAETDDCILDSGVACAALCQDAVSISPDFDLVYIDPPYINRAGTGVDYRDFYHFLEGLLQYDTWSDLIDRKSKHLRLVREPSPWTNARQNGTQFRNLFDRFRKSTLVVSYRSDGIPTIDELATWLRDVKRRVRIVEGETYQYALSKNRKSREVLLVATD